MSDLTWVLKSPRLTEKATRIGSLYNVYTFHVHSDANKIQIKQAIKDLYKVTALRVNVIIKKSERVRTRKGKGMKQGFKKAIVVLASGDSISFV